MSDQDITQDQMFAGELQIERLEEQKKALAAGIKDVCREAMGGEFDEQTLCRLLVLMARDRSLLEESEAILRLYLADLCAPYIDDDDA